MCVVCHLISLSLVSLLAYIKVSSLIVKSYLHHSIVFVGNETLLQKFFFSVLLRHLRWCWASSSRHHPSVVRVDDAAARTKTHTNQPRAVWWDSSVFFGWRKKFFFSLEKFLRIFSFHLLPKFFPLKIFRLTNIPCCWEQQRCKISNSNDSSKQPQAAIKHHFRCAGK